MKFTLYSLETGRVLCGGESDSPDGLALVGQAILPDKAYTDGWLEGGRHYAQPPRPSPHHTFDWATKKWIDPRTLEDLRADKLAILKSKRAKAEAQVFLYMGKMIQGDEISTARIERCVRRAADAVATGEEFSIAWRTADNSLLALDGPQMVEMLAAQDSYFTSIYDRLEQLREKLKSAKTMKQINEISWE